MTPRSILGLAALACVAFGYPAHAGNVLDDLLGGKAGPKHKYACFTRVYDDAHLLAHPQQNVRTMKMLVTVTPEPGPSDYTLDIASTFRSRKGVLRTGGNCSLGDEKNAGGKSAVDCNVSCGGESITVTLKASASVLVAIPAGAQLWNPANPDDNLVKSAFGPDDKLFRLDRAPNSACAELGEDEKAKRELKGM